MENLEKAIEHFSYDDKRYIKEIIEALDEGKGLSIEFSSDGSCVCFHYISKHGNHGLPCTVSTTLGIEQSLIILAGHRLKSHGIPQCF